MWWQEMCGEQSQEINYILALTRISPKNLQILESRQANRFVNHEIKAR